MRLALGRRCRLRVRSTGCQTATVEDRQTSAVRSAAAMAGAVRVQRVTGPVVVRVVPAADLHVHASLRRESRGCPSAGCARAGPKPRKRVRYGPCRSRAGDRRASKVRLQFAQHNRGIAVAIAARHSPVPIAWG